MSVVAFAEEFAILMIKFLTNNSAGWSLLMSDDSTKPTEVTPETAVVAVVKPEVEESVVKLVAENLRDRSWTIRFEIFSGGKGELGDRIPIELIRYTSISLLFSWYNKSQLLIIFAT